LYTYSMKFPFQSTQPAHVRRSIFGDVHVTTSYPNSNKEDGQVQ
jgi:hypothetical protein